MELVPRKRFGELGLGTFRDEMNKLWDRFFEESPFRTRFLEEWGPSVDMSETKDKFVVTAELPGLEARDVNISLTGDVLTIKGEKTQESKEEDEQRHVVERYYCSFE